MTIATVAVVAAVGTVAAAGASIYSTYEQGQIANQQLSLADQTMQKQNYYNNQLMQLMSNPSSITTNPGYQQAVQSAAQATGAMYGGRSGEGEAMTIAAGGSFLSQQENLLAQLSGANAPTSAGSALAGASASQSAAAGQLGSLLYGSGYLLKNTPTTPTTTTTTPSDWTDAAAAAGVS